MKRGGRARAAGARWLDRGLGDGTTSATVETAARAQVVALQEQLNTEARTNAELAAENRRCRALLGNDQRLQELEAEAQRSDAQVAESQGALDRTKVRAQLPDLTRGNLWV